MKKLFLSIATLSLMSFTSVKIYQNYVLSESINTIQDMKEWMTQDIENGNINFNVRKLIPSLALKPIFTFLGLISIVI